MRISATKTSFCVWAIRRNSIKDYFLDYDESVSNDFVLSHGGRRFEFMQRDIDDWTITFVDTGATATIASGYGGRAVLEGEDVFLANYSDGLTDLPLPAHDGGVLAQQRVMHLCCSVQPTASSLDTVQPDQDGSVRAFAIA